MSSFQQSEGFILIHRDWSGRCVPSCTHTVGEKKVSLKTEPWIIMRAWPTFFVRVMSMCSVCTCTFPQSLSHCNDGSDDFLDTLLNVCECGSGSSSPLWALSPCDSGISDDHLDSSPPPPTSSNLLFDSLNTRHHHLLPFSPPPLIPSPQTQQQHGRWASSSAERDISIDVGKKPWFSGPYKWIKVQGRTTALHL